MTDGTANETSPVINDAGLLTWESDRDSTVIAGKFSRLTLATSTP